MILGLKHNIIAGGQFDPPSPCSKGDPSTSVKVGLKPGQDTAICITYFPYLSVLFSACNLLRYNI